MLKKELVRVNKSLLKLNQFQLLEINGFSIWLKPNHENSVAFFNSCAHKGGGLTCDKQFVCSQHGWTYSLDGSNKFSGAPGLEKVAISHETIEYIEFLLPFRPARSSKIPQRI